MTDIYNEYLLRRWTMDEQGLIGCYHDAIDTRLHSAEIISAVQAHNDLLHDATDQRRAYEDALRVQEWTGPQTIDVLDDAGEVVGEDTHPEYRRWIEAQAVVATVPAAILAWIAAEQPEPQTDTDEHVAWAQAVADRDAAYRDNAPAFAVMTDGPALHPLLPEQFWGMVYAAGIKSAIDGAIDAIPDAMQRGVVRARFERAKDYHRSDPLFAAMAPTVGLTEAQIDALWMQAAAL